MPSVTDNDLDKLFREASDRNMPEFDPQDWEDMVRRLEHEERAATMRSKSLYTLVAILIIYALLPTWGQKENVQSASIFETQESTEVTGIISSNEGPGSENGAGSDKGKNVNPVVQDNDKGSHEAIETGEDEIKASIRIMNALRQEREKTNGKVDKDGIDRSVAGEIATENSNSERFISPKQSKNSPKVETFILTEGVASNREATNGAPTERDHFTARVTEEIASGDRSTTNEVDLTKITLYDLPPYEQSELIAKVTRAESVIKPVEQAEGDLEQPATVIKPDRRTSQRWFIKVPVSPDFSAIDYADLGDPGINIGLLGEYNLTPHLSVSTGAIWSKKLYYSENPDKSYSSGNWTGKASMLDGDCRVLDIPVNFTYYIFPARRTNLFVSVGSSSYIMLKEQYVYTVWANQKEYQYEENFSNENNEWFSMLNLSIGIQHRLGKRFFAQAEPFLKAPISGVGEGKVNLMSTGIFFSLKYSLNK